MTGRIRLGSLASIWLGSCPCSDGSEDRALKKALVDRARSFGFSSLFCGALTVLSASAGHIGACD